LALCVYDGDDAPGNVTIYDFARRSWTPFTSHPAEDGRRVCTPDGSRLAFRSFREGTSQLYWQSADGTGSVDRLTGGANPDRALWSFSPDGQELVFSELSEPTYDLQVLKLGAHTTR